MNETKPFVEDVLEGPREIPGYNAPQSQAIEELAASSSETQDYPGFELKIPKTGIPLEQIERRALIEALQMSNWIQKDAAELLSISPRIMNYKINKLEISFPPGRRPRWERQNGKR